MRILFSACNVLRPTHYSKFVEAVLGMSTGISEFGCVMRPAVLADTGQRLSNYPIYGGLVLYASVSILLQRGASRH